MMYTAGDQGKRVTSKPSFNGRRWARGFGLRRVVLPSDDLGTAKATARRNTSLTNENDTGQTCRGLPRLFNLGEGNRFSRYGESPRIVACSSSATAFKRRLSGMVPVPLPTSSIAVDRKTAPASVMLAPLMAPT
jgi:hypothetical protein